MKTQEFIDTDLISSTQPSDEISLDGRKTSLYTSPSRAELDSGVEETRQQIFELRRQQEELEKLRQELEDLRQRQEEFENGKAEMLEELSRVITRIEQEEFELNQRSTLLSNFRKSHQEYIQQLQEIHESEWSREELKSQLGKAVSVVNAARAELNKGHAQLNFAGENPMKVSHAFSGSLTTGSSDRERGNLSFALEFQRGLARSLPLLIVLGLIALILLTRGR